MIKKLEDAHMKFVLHFGYSPNFPSNIDFDQEITQSKCMVL